MPRCARVGALVVLGLLATACGNTGDDGPSGVDAGVDAATGFAPEPPAPPVLTPCPAGWRDVVTGTDVHVCEPWPESGRDPACADDAAHFPGEPACARVGTACLTSGDFADGLPTDRTIVYVLASAAAGGDGSLARPYASLASGLMRAAASDAIVALGRGRYGARVTIPDGVTLWGACTAETLLTGDVLDGTVTPAAGATAELRNLTIDSPGTIALASPRAGGTLTVEDVIVRRATTAAAAAFDGGALVLRGVVLRDTAAPGGIGVGLSVESGGTIEATRLVVERMTSSAILARERNSTLTATAVAIEDVSAPSGAPLPAFAIESTLGARVVLSAIVIERASESAVVVESFGSQLELRDAVIRDILPRARGDRGRGVEVGGGAMLRVERTWIEHVAEVALLAGGSSTVLDARDVVVHDVRESATTVVGGYGIAAQHGAAVVLRRVSIELAVSGGLLALLDASSLDAEDVSVRDIPGNLDDGHFGRGIDIEQTATATLRRVRIAGTHDFALGVLGAGSRADASDVDVADTGERPCVAAGTCTAGYGDGVAALHSGTLSLQRFHVARSATCGAMVATDGSLDLATGRFTENQIAVCVQVDGYDFARLSSSVTLERNERNLESTSLPVPDAVPAL